MMTSATAFLLSGAPSVSTTTMSFRRSGLAKCSSRMACAAYDSQRATLRVH
jgi:hypothetical protein